MNTQKSGLRADRISYRQGEKTVWLESLDDVWSVRYAEPARTAIRDALGAFGDLHEIANQRLFIVKLADKKKRDELLESIQRLLDEGAIEFFTPVLRDPASDLRRILTDEICVRFKKVPSAGELKIFEKRYGVTVARQNEFAPAQFIVKVNEPEGLRTLEVANQIEADGEVEFAAPNFLSEYRR